MEQDTVRTSPRYKLITVWEGSKSWPTDVQDVMADEFILAVVDRQQPGEPKVWWSKPVSTKDPEARDVVEREREAWLAATYPDYQDPAAYWD